MDGKLDEALKVLVKHDDRINELEKGLDTLQGKATILGMVGGAIMSVIGLIIGYFGLKK